MVEDLLARARAFRPSVPRPDRRQEAIALASFFRSVNRKCKTTMPEASVTDTRAVTRDVFSATLGSVCCCYTGQPFDTVKVRMQTNPTQFSGVVSSTLSILTNEVGVVWNWSGHKSSVDRPCSQLTHTVS